MSFGPFAVGLGKGYTSPALASLLPNSNEDDSNEIPPFSPHLPNITITEQQGSWIASLSLLGALFGGLCSGLIIKHGRRKTLIYVSIPFSISWAFTLFAYCVEMIYATAFVAGFCSAIIQVSRKKISRHLLTLALYYLAIFEYSENYIDGPKINRFFSKIVTFTTEESSIF